VESLRVQLEIDKVYIPVDPTFGAALGAAVVLKEET
jgi:hypothetical protein